LFSLFQLAFYGGDKCRVRSVSSAIRSAYLEPNSQSMHKPIGGLSAQTSLRERFMKQTANQHKTKQRQQNMSTTKLTPKGIFFDLDGTIVDSREAYLEAARTAFQAMRQEPPSLRTALEIPRRLEQKQPLNPIIAGDTQKFLDVYLRTYYSITMEKTTLIPNIQTALKILSEKAKLALITMRNVPKEAITAELTRFGIAQYFTHVVTAMDTHKPKPSPEALIKTVKAIDVQICDCLIVGDSTSDIQAGKAAGAKTVAVLSGLFSRQELAKQNPDLILKNATTLPNHLA
jgi:HAD superfamily hydrolase (TIGR01509 family)